MISKSKLWRWYRMSSLDGPVRRGMQSLGLTIGQKPWPFLVIPILVLAALAFPFVQGVREFLRMQREEPRSLELFTPRGSLSTKTKERLIQIFPDGGYFSDRSLLSPNLLIILVSASDGRTVLRPTIVQEYLQTRSDIELGVTVNRNGTEFDYDRLCSYDVYGIHCRDDPLRVFAEKGEAFPEITYPTINFTVPDASGSRLQVRSENIGPLLGGVATDRRSRIVYAKYVKMIFNLPPIPSDPDLLRTYGEAWADYVRTYQSAGLNLTYWSAEQYRRDLGLVSRRTFRLLPILLGLLFLFALGSCCMADAVLSKPWLALCGVISSAGGIICGYSLLFIANVPLIEIAMIVPFLVLSIGIDDMFVMLNVWRKIPNHSSVAERLSLTMRESGVSITVTTLTDAGVFLIGTASVFPAVTTFCIYSSISIIFVFVFQVTFFAGCMAISGRREAGARHCITFTKAKNSDLYRCGCRQCCSDARERMKRKNRSTPWATLFLQNTFSKFLCTTMAQAVTGATYLLYIGLSTFCLAYRLDQGLQISHLVPYDTDTFKYLKTYEDFFSRYRTAAEVVIAEPMEYSDPSVQQELFRLKSVLEDTPFSMTADFWLFEFLKLLPSNEFSERESFYRTLIDGFLRVDPYYRYSADINMFQAEDGRYFINSSRFYVPLRNLGHKNRSTAMGALVERVDLFRASGFPLLLHDVSFPLAEQFEAIVPGVCINVAVAGMGILLVSLLFIPCFRSCLVVSLSVLSINFGVLGFMAAWRVHLDIISSITLLLSIGFSVDFCGHIVYHFHHAEGTSGSMKVAKALGTVGFPIIQSSVSTIVGVVTLIGVGGKITDTFVKTVVLVMVIGVYHGLFILPVVLCLFTDCTNHWRTKVEKHYATSKVSDQVPRRKRREESEISGFSGQSTEQTGRSTTKPDTIATPDTSVPSRVAVVKPQHQQRSRERRGKATYRSFIHGKQHTVRVDTAWIDSWLHGDIACSQHKGKYCAYCDTRDALADDIVKVKSLSHRSDEVSTWQR